MMMVTGIVFVLAGCFGLYWTGKRAFYRRNVAGIEEFNSYGGALATRAFEKVIKVASWLALVFGAMIVLAFLMHDPDRAGARTAQLPHTQQTAAS